MKRPVRSIQPPGPRGRALRQAKEALRHHALTAYLALRADYGAVVRLAMFPHPPLYLLSHPDAVQHVLRDQAHQYRKGIGFEPIATLQGQGLLTSDGALWRQQRRLMQPAFHPRQVLQYSAIVLDEAQAVVRGWSQAAQSGMPVEVNAWMHRLTFRVVGRALLGLPPEQLDRLARTLQRFAGPLMHHFASWSPYRWHLPSWLPTSQQRRVRRAVAGYRAVVDAMIVARQQMLQEHAQSSTDVLAQLLAAVNDAASPQMTMQQLRDEVITLIGAGVETTALALGWAFYLLAQHADVMQQVHSELATVLSGRLPTPQDLPQLSYSRMVLDETLRLYPPAAVLPRQANAADTIDGYAIPKNAVVMLSQYVTHRHPDFWHEPEQFRPERFTSTQRAHQHRFAYFPFGEGPRVCIGKPFALLEMHLVLASIAQAYTFHLVANQPIVPVLSTTLRPRDGLWLRVVPV